MRDVTARRVGVAMFLLCIPVAAFPNDLEKCLKDATAQRELEHCADAAYREAHKKLDALYEELLVKLRKAAEDPLEAGIPGRVGGLLQESQALWAKYREANCNMHAAKFGRGTMTTLERLMCYVQMTGERLRELQELTEALNL